MQADAGQAPRAPRTAEVEVYVDPAGVEVVVVPGAENVTLGWDSGFAPLDEQTRQDILEDLARAVDPLAAVVGVRRA